MEFDSLKTLLDCLTNDELSILVKKCERSKRNSVLGHIVKFCKENKSANPDLIMLHVYKKINEEAFRKACDRLTSLIYNVIVDSTIENKTTSDTRSQMIFNSEYNLLLSDILRYRGQYSLSEKVLNSVIENAKCYESYDLLIFALGKKLKSYSYSKSTNFDALNEEIRFYRDCSDKLVEATIIFYNAANSRQGFLNKSSVNLLDAADAVNQCFLLTKSNTIRYYKYLLEFTLKGELRNYSEAISIINELIQFIKDNPSVYSKARFASALVNKAFVFRNIFDFETSFSILNESLKYLKLDKISSAIFYEQLFLTAYYEGNLDKIKYQFKLLSDCHNADEVAKFKVQFYLGNLYFIEYNFKQAVMHLNKIGFRSSGVDVWDLERRILIMLSQIELEDLDSFEISFNNFNKIINRKKFNSCIDERYFVIKDILARLIKSNYNFKYIHQLLEENNYLLFSWKINTPEMIVFQEWFEAKASGKKYDHTAVMANMKRVNMKIKREVPEYIF